MPKKTVEDAASERLCPELASLLELWRVRYGSQPLSEQALLTAVDMHPWSRNLAQIEQGADGRFHVRKFGIDLIRRFGRESTGHCVDDLAQDIRESLQGSIRRCLSTGAPVAAHTSVHLGRDAAQFQELVLPVTSSMVLFAAYERK